MAGRRQVSSSRNGWFSEWPGKVCVLKLAARLGRKEGVNETRELPD